MDPAYFPLITAIIAVGGVISGTVLGSKLGESRERKNWLRDQRGQTYLAVIKFAYLLQRQQNFYDNQRRAVDPDLLGGEPEIEPGVREEMVARLRLYAPSDMQQLWDNVLVAQAGLIFARTALGNNMSPRHPNYENFNKARGHFTSEIITFCNAANSAISEQKTGRRRPALSTLTSWFNRKKQKAQQALPQEPQG